MIQKWSLPLTIGFGITLLLWGLHFYTASKRGLIYYDEAYYVLEATSIREGLKSLPPFFRHQTTLSDIKTSIRKNGGIFPPGVAKPTLIAYFTLGMLLLPLPPDCAAISSMVLAGILCCYMLYLCGRLLNIPRTLTLWMALLLAASPLWSYYVISAMPPVLATLFFLLAIEKYLKNELIYAGIFISLSYTTHYGMMIHVAVFSLWVVCDAWHSFHQSKSRSKGLAFFFISMLAPACLWELIFRIGRHAMRTQLSDVVYLTYFEQVARQMHRSSAFVADAHLYWSALIRNAYILTDALAMQGIVLSSFLLASIFVAFKNVLLLPKNARWILLLYVTHLGFWLVNPGAAATRVTVTALPLLFLGAGLGIHHFLSVSKRQGESYSWVCLGLLLLTILNSSRSDFKLRSPYPAAVSYLHSQNYTGPVVSPADWPMWQYYLGQRIFLRPEALSTPAALKEHLFGKKPSSKDRIAFFYLDNSTNSYNPYFEYFLQMIFKRPPDRVWETPYSSYRIFHNDANSPELLHRSTVAPLFLYWVRPSDFELLT